MKKKKRVFCLASIECEKEKNGIFVFESLINESDSHILIGGFLSLLKFD